MGCFGSVCSLPIVSAAAGSSAFPRIFCARILVVALLGMIAAPSVVLRLGGRGTVRNTGRRHENNKGGTRGGDDVTGEFHLRLHK
jgi:hypothetical protein